MVERSTVESNLSFVRQHLRIRRMQKLDYVFFVTILICIGMSTVSQAQYGWRGNPPELIDVKGSLRKSDTVEIKIRHEGKEKYLYSCDAIGVLSSLGYVEFDPVQGRWRTTQKYEHWKKNRPSVPPSDTSSPSSNRIKVTSPSGGAWHAESRQVIRWEYHGSPGELVNVELIRRDERSGRDYFIWIAQKTKNTGSFNWTVRNMNPYFGRHYRIRVTSASDNQIRGISEWFSIERSLK
jgi:hypothetical protein